MADNDLGTVDFELVSPAQLLVSEPADMVVVPGSEGDIGVLPGHSPLIASLRPGVIEIYKTGSVKDRIFVGGGFAEVSTERCTVLAEEATHVRDIDTIQAENRLSELRQNLETTDEPNSKEMIRQLTIAEGLVAASKQTISD